MGSLIYLTKFPEFDGVPYSHDFLRVIFCMFLHCRTLKKCDFFGRASRASGVPYFHDFFGKSEFLWGPLLTPPNLAEFGMRSLIKVGVFIYNTAVHDIVQAAALKVGEIIWLVAVGKPSWGSEIGQKK